MEKFYLGIYKFFKISLVAVFLKYCYDFYILNRIVKHTSDSVINDKIILKPRLQLERERFDYARAERGIILDDGKYQLYNVDIMSDVGIGRSDMLVVDDKQEILDFTGNAKFTIYGGN
jgi:hypothetical protein